MNLANEDAERAVVASVLLKPEEAAVYLDRVGKCGVRVDDFTGGDTRKAYESCLDLAAKGSPVDALTVSSSSGVPVGTLAAWIDATPTAAHAEFYAKIVHGLAVRRRLVDACQQGARIASDDGKSEAVAAAVVEAAIAAAVDGAGIHTGGALGSLLQGQLAVYREGLRRGYGGLRTGLAWLDDVFGGLAAGRLYIVSGPPACGKTTLVRNVAVDLAKAGHRVAFATLEIVPEELAAWMACAEAGISMRELDGGQNAGAVERFAAAATDFAKLPISIEGGPMGPDVFTSWARREVRRGAELVALDYMQLLQATPGDHDENEERRVSRASAAVLQTAIACKVPVLAIASESNAGTLRHSGQLSYDCAGHIRLAKREDGTGPDVEFRKIRHGSPVDGKKSLYFSRGRLVETDPRATNMD